jgi:8-oxo-dGTP diphosphatase
VTEPRFCLVPAVYVVLRRRTHGRREVLLQFRDGTGFMDRHWACGAAGHVEAGESLFQAAVREAREELDITVTPDDLVPLVVVHRRHDDDDDPINQRIDVFFACDTWTGEPRTVEADKSSDLRWFDVADLPEPVVPHEARVLRALAAGDLPLVATYGFDD